jgi:hypothetical protein
VDERDRPAERFEANRAQPRAVASQILGSLGEADDAAQEAWLHLSRSGTSGVESGARLPGYVNSGMNRAVTSMPRHASHE